MIFSMWTLLNSVEEIGREKQKGKAENRPVAVD